MKKETVTEEVYSVDTVCFSINKCNPPQIIVQATGMANSSGWSGGTLEAAQYIEPPQDGIQDFTFFAEPPSGIVLWVMTPIAGVGGIEQFGWVKGVRVTASGKSIVSMLDDASCSVDSKEI